MRSPTLNARVLRLLRCWATRCVAMAGARAFRPHLPKMPFCVIKGTLLVLSRCSSFPQLKRRADNGYGFIKR
jgi:hypothetical protein